MIVAARLGVIAAVLAGPAVARAEHDHGEVPHAGGGEHPFAASVGLIAARYQTMLYGGDYQAIVPGLRWFGGRLSASAQVGLYRLVENGRTIYGAGDVVATGQATIVTLPRGAAGVALAVSAPTGEHQTGLGMGHVMVMPSLWGSYAVDRVVLGASAGYTAGLGGAANHADHGAWPLVDPMTRSELTTGASVTVTLTRELRAGVRATGALPIGAGDPRLIAGVRAAWTAGRVETVFELQTGLAGDPFTIRGVLATSLNF